MCEFNSVAALSSIQGRWELLCSGCCVPPHLPPQGDAGAPPWWDMWNAQTMSHRHTSDDRRSQLGMDKKQNKQKNPVCLIFEQRVVTLYKTEFSEFSF